MGMRNIFIILGIKKENRNFKFFCFFCVLIIGGYHLNAQDTLSISKSRFQFSEVQIVFGLVKEIGEPISHNEFKRLAPNSPVHNYDLSGYTNRNYQNNDLRGQLSLLAGIKFTPRNKNFYSVFRLGIMYSPELKQTYGLQKSQTIPYDTLSSGSTGQTIYINETTTDNIYMGYTANYVSTDLSMVFHSLSNRRLKIMAGLGCTIGMTLNAQTVIGTFSSIHYNSSDHYGDYLGNFYYNNRYGTMTIEKYNNQNHAVVSTYIPLGFNFRIGKQHKFLSQLYLSYEARPGLVTYRTDANKRYTNLFFQNLLGLKLKWN